MNFFAAQDKARKHTLLLAVVYVSTIILLIGLTEWLLLMYMGTDPNQLEQFNIEQLYPEFDRATLMGVTIVVLLTTGMASLYKYSQLRAGGQAVAESMDGRLLNLNTQDADEKKIVNIVQEMAIASGMPVPAVYLFEENGINAFAAGFTPNTAIIGVTRGCIRFLDREELQGVIAHEFSHIFNGDMRFNLHLITTLYGITFIGLMGQFMMRSLFYGQSRHSSRSSRSSGSNGLPLIGLAIGLTVIGYLGTFFGSIIRAAISRQREYLADATAVRYTRNNEGIANALKKIGGYGYHARLTHPSASEFGHLFFAAGLGRSLSQLFSTHPPLKQRIHALQPRWNGRYPKVELPDDLRINPDVLHPQKKAGAPPEVPKNQAMFVSAMAVFTLLDRREAIPFDSHNVQNAHRLINAIPDEIYQAVHESYGARAVCYALLIDKTQPNVRKRQLQRLQISADPDVYKLTLTLLSKVESLSIELYLPLVELSVVALRMLSKTEFSRFRENIDILIQADRKLDVFEWCLSQILLKYIDVHTVIKRSQIIKQLSTVTGETQTLLLFLLRQYPQKDNESERLTQAFSLLGQNFSESQSNEEAVGFFELNQALDILRNLEMDKKILLIKACAQCLVVDDKIAAEPYMLLRVIADLLDISLPATA